MRKRDKTWAAGGATAGLELMRFGNRPARKGARSGATATVATYRDDPLYGRIERAVATILATGKVVTPD